MFSSFSSVSNEISNLGFEIGFGSAIYMQSGFSGLDPFSPRLSMIKKARTIRLKSANDKYLIADEDEKSVTQNLNGSPEDAKWAVEFVKNLVNVICLRSCYGKYLTASKQLFVQGMTSRRVLQTVPKRLDSSVEWEIVWENGVVKLKTRYGRFSRANGVMHPWRNSVESNLNKIEEHHQKYECLRKEEELRKIELEVERQMLQESESASVLEDGQYPKVVFLKVDIDEAPLLAAEYKPTLLPISFFFVRNGREIDNYLGVDMDLLEAKLAQNERI
ncbi:hypothetical protein CASFOL_015168 [Castilleja foliolosa]|uniref:DUF569 domain-containing protein n=1 Tax=Castilleja foliolosa TaxID=1961234 RepID=A0ABD3DCY6_9LAMI